MKKIILIILALITAHTFQAYAQDILWKKNFGLNTADDFGRSVIETNDGNIAIAGYTGSYGAGGFDVWLIKTDADGNILWSKTYGGSGDDYAYSMKQTEDGGFIIGGSTNSFGVGGLDYYLIKTDSLGDTLWTKTFGGVNDDICWSLVISEDELVLAGEKNSNLPFHPDMWIIKTDQLGNQIWEKTYAASADEIAFSVEESDESGFTIVGQIKLPDTQGWLLKTNTMGDTLWTKTFGGISFNDWFRSIFKTNDNGHIITGARYSGSESVNVWLLKTDSLGNVEWEKTYDYHNEYDIGYSVQQTIDGGYIVCGSREWDVDYGWIIRTNSVGDTLWTKVIESYSLSPQTTTTTICYSVIQAQNGDYIVAGVQAQPTFQSEGLLLRISSDIVPVELTSFTATVMRNSVSLNWQTATETNNSGFEIEGKQVGSPQSSLGNQEWSIIGFVPGFGTTTESKSYSFIEEDLPKGKYQYRLKQIDFDGSFEYSNTVEVEITSPTEFALEQNYPNPFNPSTNIQYSISSRQFVTLKIFNLLGQELETLVNEFQEAGVHSTLYIVNSTLPSGVYYYQLRADGFVKTKKMILLR